MRGKGKEEGTVFNNEKRKKHGRKSERARESLLPARSLLAAAAVSVVTLFLGPDLTNPLTCTDRHYLLTYLVLPTYQFPNDTHGVSS